MSVHTNHTNRQRTYPHGVPCWVDNQLADLDAASRFTSGTGA
jgi:hypothetical protein